METTEKRPGSSLRKDDYSDDDFDKELDSFIMKEEQNKKKDDEQMEKGQAESQETKKKDRQVLTLHSDNEDSEADDYNLTEDQKRALEELDNLKTEMGYPDEDPPEYDVKERLKVLNEDLKNDPTPIEKQKDSKVGFKPNLVDLVAPPPDFSDDEESKSKPKTEKKEQNKDSTDKVDSKSETIPSKKSNGSSSKKDKVLIEKDGEFQLVDSDDVKANDLGYAMDHDKENEKRKTTLEPSPPGKPRPATAASNNRRNIRTGPAPKSRPHSAQPTSNGSTLDNFSYNSPYALSPREKQLLEERKKALEKQRQQQERKKREEDENKERENRECFESWLKKKRESDRRKKIEDEEDRKKKDKEDRYFKPTGDATQEEKENEEAFKGWLKDKNNQFRKEKLLKRRQDQEMQDGYYVRSREECEKAFKQWLKQKALAARRARAAERQKAKLQRLAVRRSRKAITLGKSIKESQSFRYVDYYGYRF